MGTMVPRAVRRDDEPASHFLEDSQAVLRALELGEVSAWRWQVGSKQLEWTRNLETVHQLPEGAFDGTLRSFTGDIHPEDKEAVWAAIRQAIETGEEYEVRYRAMPRDHQDPVWIHAKGAKAEVDGTAYLTGTCHNVTREVEAEEELLRRLRHLEGISELGTFALGERDFDKVLDRAVEVAARMFEVPLAKILQFSDTADDLVLKAGRGWKDGLVGHAHVGIDRDSQAGFTLSENRPVIVRDLSVEDRFSGPELLIDHAVVSGLSVAIGGRNARPFGVLGVHDTRPRAFDVSDAKSLQALANVVANAAQREAARSRQAVLTKEVNHRANNLLQIVGIIAKQTFRPTVAPSVAVVSFRDRLTAIARANALISDEGWAPTRLRTVVEEVLPSVGHRLTIIGRDVVLQPQVCFDVALVLHELATNSMKYGSLRKADGKIAIEWSIASEDDGMPWLKFSWSDPHTQQLPHSGSGFGSQLMRMLIESNWKGQVSVDTRGGYKFSFSFPLPLKERQLPASSGG